MYCKNCGAENQTNSNFCVACENDLTVDSGFNGNSANTMNDTIVLNPVNETPVSNNVEETSVLNSQNTNNMYGGFSPNAYQQNNYMPNAFQAGDNAYTQTQNVYNQIITKEEFFTKLLSKNSKSWVKALWIICFITAAVSVVGLVLGNLLSLLDVVFYLVMGILLMKKNDWRLALVVTCYSGFWSVVGLVTTGTVSGIFALICGIMATKTLKKAEKSYEQYKTTGLYPAELI